MSKNRLLLSALLILIVNTGNSQTAKPGPKAIFLENISWTAARDILTPDAVVVIPLGAGSKEHGPHLPLSTDKIQADGLAKMVALERKVIITPTVNYGYYPAFLEYPGSTSLSFSGSTDMILFLVRSLANYGPRRFYIINIGVSTTPTLEMAAKVLANEGILLYYSDYERPNFENTEKAVRTKEFSGHADEIETSNILWFRPDLVDMRKAVNDSSTKDSPIKIMSPVPFKGAILNASGIEGYARLGTKEKGRKAMAGFCRELIRDIDSITTCALPQPKDRTRAYLDYQGEYRDTAAQRSITLKGYNNKLFLYLLPDAEQDDYFHLYQDDTDYFTSFSARILFIRDEQGHVTKAWYKGQKRSFWMIKMK